MCKPSFCFITVLLLNLLKNTINHYIPKIKGPNYEVTGYINQAKQIPIPFKKCFQVQPQLPANSKYIQFQPSSLKLSELQKIIISENRDISVLEDLRSPRTNTHQHLIVFDSYAITFRPPNQILVIELDQFQKFKLTNKIVIKEIDQYTRFKLYKFQNQAMLLLEITDKSKKNAATGYYQMTTQAFLINNENYWQIKVPFKGSVAHLQADGREFFTAEYGDGINCYSYSEDKKSATLVGSYQKSLFQNWAPYPYIVDVNIQSLKSHKIIYALDSIKGVYRLNLTESVKTPKVELIVSQPNCHAMDSMNIDHLVLVCQLGTSSYIVQAYATLNQKGQSVFQKLQPEYHVNYFNDLEMNKNYFLVFSHRMLNVYWSSKENNIPQTVNTRSQLDLPGLETFFFRMNSGPDGQSYLYIIQSGTFKQLQITESPARLTVKSQSPLEKRFKISIFGNCQDLAKPELQRINNEQKSGISSTNSQNLANSTCELESQITLQTVIENSPRKQDFSVSASIIVILIVIFLLIIWICLKKYKGLQKQARRVLDAYKKKKTRSSRI